MRKINGRQQDWQAIKKTTDKPIITIITSTFKAKEALRWTYESIKNQTYPYIQWIIVDGASTDGTVELLEQYSDVIDVWFSESDTGIYDAWNKALEYIQGDWVQFLGAGDELYEKDTLEKASVYLKDAYPKYELVYGQVYHISATSRELAYISGEPWANYKNKWHANLPALPPHQGVFQHSSVFKNIHFDTRFRILADMHLLLQLLDKDFLYISQVVSLMPLGGVSNTVKGGQKCYEEVEVINEMLGIQVPILPKTKAFLRYYFTKNALKIMSEENYGRMIDMIKVLRGKPKVFTV